MKEPTAYLVRSKPKTGLPTFHRKFDTVEAALAHMHVLVDARLKGGNWSLVPPSTMWDADPRHVLLRDRDGAVGSFISDHRAAATREPGAMRGSTTKTLAATDASATRNHRSL